MAAKPPEAEIGTEDLTDQFKKINLSNEQNIIKQAIPLWLKHFESPFLWDSKKKRAKTEESIIDRCLEKLEELNLEEYEFALIRYAVLLKLIVEYTYLENDDQVNETMKIIKSCIKKEEKQEYPQYEKLKSVLDHIILTTEAHLLALQGLEDQSREVSLKVVKIEKLPNHTKAGLFALKSIFFQYSGLEHAEDLAVENARQALELEPDSHEWMFTLAKMLRQQRKEIPFNAVIPREEIVLLEKALAQAKYPRYLEYLAQVYQESSAKAIKQYKNDRGFFEGDLFKTITEMQRKSLNYFKRALDMKPTNPAMLRRIGYGIMQLPRKMTDYDLALKCLLESASMCENTKILHILGTFYHRYGNKYKCIFLRMNEPINMYQYLANEAMLYLKKNNNNEEVKALLETIENIHPKFTNNQPDPRLITKLCLMSEEIKNKYKSLDYGEQNRRENQRGGNSCNRWSSGNSERPFYGSWRTDDRNQERSQRGRSWRNDDRNQDRSQRERSDNYNRGQNRARSDEEKGFWRRQE